MDTIGTAMLLLPFLLVQLIGPGAMPQFSPDGLEIVLCSEGELKTGSVRADGTFHEGGAEHFSPCYWAVTGAPLLETTAVQLPVPAEMWMPVVPVSAKNVVLTVHIGALPPARAPPLIV